MVLLHIAHKRVWVHTALKGPKVLSAFKRQREILENIEVDLEDRGITTYYTCAATPRQRRYAEFMGFELNGEVVDGTPYEVMVKEL